MYSSNTSLKQTTILIKKSLSYYYINKIKNFKKQNLLKISLYQIINDLDFITFSGKINIKTK